MSRKKIVAWQWLLVMIMGAVVLSGCAKNTEVTSIPEAPGNEQASAARTSPDADQAQKEPQSGDPGQAGEQDARERAAAADGGLQPVYFDFDRSFIRDDARQIMSGNAEWLKAHPRARIKIEGNCDDRGTAEYNQALGQRRAANAKKYLMDLGISGERISLISYGKEKPFCTESTETCRQKNRRDDFVVVSE